MAKKVPVAAQDGEIDAADAQVKTPVAGAVSTDTSTAKEKAAATATGVQPTVKAGKNEVIVRVSGAVPNGPKGGSHRVFSKEQHGDDFKAQADAYAKKFDGTVVDIIPGTKVCPTCGQKVS